MTKSILRKYAKLIVKMGVNIKKGQGAVILADTAQSEIALMGGGGSLPRRCEVGGHPLDEPGP